MKNIASTIFLVSSLQLVTFFQPEITHAERPEINPKTGHKAMKVGPSHIMDELKNWVKIFEHPTRGEWQESDKVIKMMNLRQGDVVVDIGAGSGYFTRKFARAVGPGGKAIGLDIEPELVNYMKKDAEKLNLKNYESRLGTMAESGLEPGSIDVAFICITYHHIENRVEYMRKLLKVFRKGGRVIFLEFYKKKMAFGPPSNHKDSKETIIKELRQAGYRLKRFLDFLQYQYFLEFEPIL